jgi:hypothetical protein
LNKIPDPNRIFPGRRLIVIGVNSASSPSSAPNWLKGEPKNPVTGLTADRLRHVAEEFGFRGADATAGEVRSPGTS